MTFGLIAILVVVLVVYALVRIQRLKWFVADRAPGARWERTDEVIKDVFRCGIKGYVRKSEASIHLVEAIKALAVDACGAVKRRSTSRLSPQATSASPGAATYHCGLSAPA